MVNENQTPRAILAYFWSVITAIILGYIVYRWGSEKEILTLIIGLIGGTIVGGIFGVYFGATHKAPVPDQQKTTTEITPESTTIIQEPINHTGNETK